MCVCARAHMSAQSLSRVPLFVTPVEYSLPVSSVHGIFQARILEWGVAISSFSVLPHPGIKPASSEYLALAGEFFTPVPPGKLP